MEPHQIIEIAFTVYNVPACQALWHNTAYDNTYISKARKLAFKLLTDINGLTVLEIQQIFHTISYNSVYSGLHDLNYLLIGYEKTWYNFDARDKYSMAMNRIKQL